VGTDLGERFARAMAAKDGPAMLDLLHPEVDFRGMTPGRIWDANLAATVVDDIILGKWLTARDEIVSIERIEADTVADRPRVGYRFRVKNADGVFLVEQQAYYDVEDDRIRWVRLVCSGFRPVV
jgi:hypothetical protein